MLHNKIRHATTICLAAVGMLALLFGIAYLPHNEPPELPEGVALITRWTGVTLFAVMWLLAGVVSIVLAFRVKPYGSLGVVIMLTFWSIGHLVGAIFLHTRGWLAGGIYAVVVVILLLGAYVFDVALRITRAGDPR